MTNLLDPLLEKSYQYDKEHLENTEVPLVTISASYKEDVKGLFGYAEDETIQDVVFSRAHYSMPTGVVMEAWGDKIRPEKAWMVDPTNYVSHKKWGSIELTEDIGKVVARRPLLKRLKDFVDKFGRNKLPILSSVTPPLLHLTSQIDKPLLSFHIAAGNILSEQGRSVVEMITDPHVREEYLNHADQDNFYLMVFDQQTKTEALEKAALINKEIDPERVIVTGPPIDPRIIKTRTKKRPWRSGTLKICLTTGGLGTNKPEIRQIIRQLLPELRKRPHPYQLLVYAGTHEDIYQMALDLAKEAHVAVGELDDEKAKFRLIHHPQIMDANELLIKYGFPWADGFITKPSGDMAYDAVASGSFLLTLQEWGEWEHNIRRNFAERGIGRKAIVDDIVSQLEALSRAQGQDQSWIEHAMQQAQVIEKSDPNYLNGAKNILKTYREITEKSS